MLLIQGAWVRSLVRELEFTCDKKTLHAPEKTEEPAYCNWGSSIAK